MVSLTPFCGRFKIPGRASPSLRKVAGLAPPCLRSPVLLRRLNGNQDRPCGTWPSPGDSSVLEAPNHCWGCPSSTCRESAGTGGSSLLPSFPASSSDTRQQEPTPQQAHQQNSPFPAPGPSARPALTDGISRRLALGSPSRQPFNPEPEQRAISSARAHLPRLTSEGRMSGFHLKMQTPLGE